MKKKLKWIALVILLLIVIGGVALYVNLNGIVKRTVESQSTQSLNLQTQLKSANLALFGGRLSLSDLQIASPPGFSQPHLLEVGGTDVSVKYGELRGDPVHVSSITIKRPKLTVEQAGGKFNFKSAMDLMPKSPETADPNAKPLKLVIDDLTVQDAMVVLRPGIPGLAQEINIPVPTVNLKKIGTADGSQNGAAVKDVVMQVVTVLAGEAMNSGKIPDELKALMNLNVTQMAGALGAEAQKRIAQAIPGDLGKALSGAIADPSSLTKDPGKAIEQGLGQVLGGKTGTTAPTSNPTDLIKGADQWKDALNIGGDKKPKKSGGK